MSKKASDSGIEMIEAIRTGLPPGVELDQREEAILDLAGRQAADSAAAEASSARAFRHLNRTGERNGEQQQ